MALTDWRNIRNMERVVTWKETGSYDRLLEVFYIENTKRWRVGIVDSGNLEKLKSFKTKTQALRFANQYMRTH